MSVAQVMVEMAHKKIKSANTDMVLNRQKKTKNFQEKKKNSQ